jgi:hypothetical protein
MRSVAFAIVTVAAARRANIKEHQSWGDDPLEDFAINQEAWPDCLTIPTFPGKCPIADHPGACYRTDGRMWSCWADWEESSDAECQQMTLNDEIVGFEGACEYQDYGRVVSVAEVPDCFDVNECLAECHPITDKWGACYVDDKEGIERASRCLCAPNTDQGSNAPCIQRLLAGECLTQRCRLHLWSERSHAFHHGALGRPVTPSTMSRQRFRTRKAHCTSERAVLAAIHASMRF